MIDVEIITRGLSIELLATTFGQEIRQKLIERLTDVVYSSAFFGAPWRTGNLAGSIVKEIGDSEAKIIPMAPYAPYIVFGTASHTIRPRNASCLVFQARAGDLVFTRLVRHPGTKPNPFLQRAAEDARGKAQTVFDDLWQELTD